MPKQYTRIMRAICSRPWAIMPDKLDEIMGFIEAKQAGLTIDPALVASVQAAAPAQRVSGAVAVLPLFGVISQRMNMMTEVSGGTSTEKFGKQFRALVEDPGVKAIVLDVDSPGGEAFGIEELSAEMFEMRGRKKVVAVANPFMASAAYYLASAADEIVVTPTGQVGSIGVFAVHTELSKMDEQLGITNTIIKAGKFKGEANRLETLPDTAKASMQSMIDEYYEMFVKAVARNRGVKAADVRNGYGEGRVVMGKEAVKLGLADRVATLDQTIERLMGRQSNKPLATGMTQLAQVCLYCFSTHLVCEGTEPRLDCPHCGKAFPYYGGGPTKEDCIKRGMFKPPDDAVSAEALRPPVYVNCGDRSQLGSAETVGNSPAARADLTQAGADAWRAEVERRKFELGLQAAR